MVEAGIATRRDILSAEIRLSDDVSSLVSSQRDYQLSLDRLKDVMGVPIETALELAADTLVYRAVELDERELTSRALANNPSIHSAELAVRRSRLELRLARNRRLPQLDLSASYSGSFDSPLDATTHTYSNGWLTKLTLGYPFLDPAAGAAAVEADATLAQDQDRLDQLQRQIVLSVRDIVRNVHSIGVELGAIRRTVEASDEKLRFSSAMFNLGRASNLDITDARVALDKGKTQHIQRLVDFHDKLALLESLTGAPATP